VAVTAGDLHAQAASYFAEPNPTVAVVDGFGIRLSVNRGQLQIDDGIGTYRRTRTFPRIDRTLRRVVILGTGTVSTETIRWCHALGIAVLYAGPDHDIIASTVSTTDDARLRRQQAAAYGTDVGTAITRRLLADKFAGQADVAEEILHRAIDIPDIEEVDNLDRLREIEAAVSIRYFQAWEGLRVRFARADRPPEHWTAYKTRTSPLRGGSAPRVAADPINAMLNYCYAMAEAECRLALTAMGLDPGLGFLHTDKPNRDSAALDLLEPVRPQVDRYVLRLMADHVFRARDFSERPDGACRLRPPLTHLLTETLPHWAEAAAPVAEWVAHKLAEGTAVRKRTPLTAANRIRGWQTPSRPRTETRVLQRTDTTKPEPTSRRRSANVQRVPLPPTTCIGCGLVLADRSRRFCPACWQTERVRRASERTTAGIEAIAAARAAGADPTQTEAARARRGESLRRTGAQLAAWNRKHGRAKPDPATWWNIQPRLAGLPLSELAAATGLSIAACSKIRSGKLVPHVRHWEALAALRSVGTS